MREHKRVGFIVFLVLIFGILAIFNSQEVTGTAKQSVTAVKIKKGPPSQGVPGWEEAEWRGGHFGGKE